MAYLKARKNKKGDTVWQVQVFVGFDGAGKRIIVNATSKSPRKKDAERLAAQILEERNRGTLSTDKCLMDALFQDLLNDYKIKGKDYAWAERIVRLHLNPNFGKLRPQQVTTPLIRQYIARRLQAGASNGTVNRSLAVLKRSFKLAYQATPPRVVSIPYIPMLDESAPRTGFFEHGEFLALRDALPAEIKPILTFAFWTGCRRAEILGLRWSQVDLMERIVRLNAGETKNREGRVIPLVPQLYATLVTEKQIHDQCWPDCPWVFHRYGEAIKSLHRAWAKACQQVGLWEGDKRTGRPLRLLHDCRRTTVRNLIRAGVPERIAMQISGHKTRAIFDRYDIVNEGDVKNAGEQLGRHMPEESPEKVQHLPVSETVQ